MNPPADLPTLKELGITKALANKARKAFASQRDLRSGVDGATAANSRNTRVQPLLGIAKRFQTQAKRQAIQDAATAAMPPLITDRYRLICADMSTTDAIEPESVDPIVTDLPYPREYLACFDHLAVAHRSG